MNYRGIYAITSDSLLADPDYLDKVKQALDAGISMLQYRNKGSDRDAGQRQAIALKLCCEDYKVPLVINDDLRLCRAVDAAGIHLGQQDSAAESVRRELGPGAVIGVSCHNEIDLARQAEMAGASYVAFGRFFPSVSKPNAPEATPEILETARDCLAIPVVAIGGINPENGASLIAAGADMLAVIDSVFGTEQVYENTRKLVSLFE